MSFSQQIGSDDALDYVQGDLQSLSVEEAASIAEQQQAEFDTDPEPSGAPHTVQQDASDGDSDEEDSPCARKRSAQTFLSAEDYDTELAALTIGSRDGKYERCFKMVFDQLLRTVSPFVHRLVVCGLLRRLGSHEQADSLRFPCRRADLRAAFAFSAAVHGSLHMCRFRFLQLEQTARSHQKENLATRRKEIA